MFHILWPMTSEHVVKRFYVFVDGQADVTVFILIRAVLHPLRKSFCTWTFSKPEWGLCSRSLFLSSDSHFVGSYTSPSSSCYRGCPGTLTFSQTTSIGAVVAPSVLWLTAFQHQASKARHELYTTTGDAFSIFSVLTFHSGTF